MARKRLVKTLALVASSAVLFQSSYCVIDAQAAAYQAFTQFLQGAVQMAVQDALNQDAAP